MWIQYITGDIQLNLCCAVQHLSVSFNKSKHRKDRIFISRKKDINKEYKVLRKGKHKRRWRVSYRTSSKRAIKRRNSGQYKRQLVTPYVHIWILKKNSQKFKTTITELLLLLVQHLTQNPVLPFKLLKIK